MRRLVSAALTLSTTLLYVLTVLVILDHKLYFPLAPIASQLPTALVAGYTSHCRCHPWVQLVLLFVSIMCTWVAAAMFTNEEEALFCHPLYWTPEANAPGPFLRIHSHIRCKHLVRAAVCLIWINSAIQIVYAMTSALTTAFHHLINQQMRLVLYPIPALQCVLLLMLNMVALGTTFRWWYVPMVDTALLLPAAYIIGRMMSGNDSALHRIVVLALLFISPFSTCTHPAPSVELPLGAIIYIYI